MSCLHPWKHSAKELAIIPTENVVYLNDLEGEDIISVDEYISPFHEEDPYYEEFKISNFIGYRFIYDDKSFIANVREQCLDKPLTILYKTFSELASLDLDNKE